MKKLIEKPKSNRGRKEEPDKKKQVSFYIRQSKIDAIGGMDETVKLCQCAIEKQTKSSDTI